MAQPQKMSQREKEKRLLPENGDILSQVDEALQPAPSQSGSLGKWTPLCDVRKMRCQVWNSKVSLFPPFIPTSSSFVQLCVQAGGRA